MDDPCPVVLKPGDRPLLALVMYEIVRPFLIAEPQVLRIRPRLELLAKMVALTWNVSRLENEPEGEGLADRMIADFRRESPEAGLLVTSLLLRARAVPFDHAPVADHVAFSFEGGTLYVTALERKGLGQRTAEGADFH